MEALNLPSLRDYVLENHLRWINRLTRILIPGFVFAFFNLFGQTTYYSRQTGNWNTLSTWSLTSHSVTNAPSSLPTSSDIVIIGSGHTVTLPQNVTGNASSVTVADDNVSSTNLYIGDGTTSNNPATLTINGNITVNNNGAVRLGSSTANTNRTAVLNVVNITLNGNGTFTMGNSGAAANTVSASGTLTLNGTSVVTVGSNTNNSNTFSCSGLVTIGSTATLQSGGDTGGTHTVNFQASGSALSNSGTINFASGTDQITLTVTGSTSNSGTISFGTSTGTKTFTGDVSLNSGSWNETAAVAVTFGGSFANNSTTFTSSTGIHTFSGALKTLSGSTTTSIATVDITGSYTNSGTLTVGTSLTSSGSGTLTNGNGTTGTLNIGGTITAIGLTANLVNNTVNYTGASQTVLTPSSSTYRNLAFSGSGTPTLGAALTISGNLSIGSGVTLSLGTFSHTANALFLNSVGQAGGTWGSTSSTATHKTNTYFSATTGLVTVSSSSCSSVAGYWTGSTSTDWNTTGNWCNNAVPGSSDDVDIYSTTNMPIIGAAGGLSRDLYIHSGASLTITGSNSLAVSGNWTNNGTFTANTSTVTLNGVTKTISGTAATTFNNVTLSGSASITTAVDATVGGNLTIGDGTTLNAAGFAFTVTGSTTVGSGTSGTLNITSATGTKTFTDDVTLNSGSTWNESAAATVNLAGSLINNSTSFTASTGTHTFSGTSKTFSGSGSTSIPTVTITGSYTNTGTLTVGTALSGAGSLTNGNGTTGTLNIGGTNTVNTLTATANNNTVNYTGAAQTAFVTTYYNLTVSGSGAKTFATAPTINGTLSMEGTATITVTTGGVVIYGTNATLQFNTATARTAATSVWITPFAASGGIVIANTGVINTPTSAVTLNSGIPLTINSGATLQTSNAALSVGGVTSVSGTLTLATAAAKTFTGDVTLSSGAIWNETGTSTINFGGSLTNNATTFTANTGTHNFTGTSKILSGSTTTSIPTSSFSGSYTNNGTFTSITALSGAGSLTQGTTGTLNIGGTSAIATLTATAASNTVNYNGTGQTIKSITYYNLTNSGANSLAGDATVNSTLTLAGKLTLGTYNLTLGSSSTAISGASSSNYVIANSSGRLIKTFSALSSAFIFEIGDATNYTSVVLTATAGTFSSTYTLGVNLTSTKYTFNYSTTDYLTRNWDVLPSGFTSNPQISITANYVAGDVTGTLANISEAQLNGTYSSPSSWNTLAALAAQLTATGVILTNNQSSVFTGIGSCAPVTSGFSASVTGTTYVGDGAAVTVTGGSSPNIFSTGNYTVEYSVISTSNGTLVASGTTATLSSGSFTTANLNTAGTDNHIHFTKITNSTSGCSATFAYNTSPDFTITGTTTCTTTGSSATPNWNVASTWTCGHVPDVGDNVVITSGYSVTLNNDQNAHDLTIDSNGSLTDNGAGSLFLKVYGNFTLNGTVNGSAVGYTFLGSNKTIDGLGNFVNPNTITITNAHTISSTANVFLTGGISITAGTTITNQGEITVGGAISGTGSSSSSIWINDTNSTLNIGSTANPPIFTTSGTQGILYASATGNTVSYYGAGSYTIPLPYNNTYYNLTFSGSSGTRSVPNNTTIDVLNDFTINTSSTGSVSTGTGGTLRIGGDWTDTNTNSSGGNGTGFAEGTGTGTVIFNGSQAQSLTVSYSGGENFNNLTIQNSGSGLTFNSDVIVSKTLTMTSGNVTVASGKTFTLGLDATAAANVGTLSYTSGNIIGQFQRYLFSTSAPSNPVLFPVGTSTYYRPANLTLSSGYTAGSIIAQFVESYPGNTGLSQTDGSTTPNVTSYNAFRDGYWTLQTANAFSLNGTTFDLSLTGTGFTGFPTIGNNTRLLNGTIAGSITWAAFNGNHSTYAGSNIVSRTGMNVLSSSAKAFGFGDDTVCPTSYTTLSISGDNSICAGEAVSQYTIASPTAGSTYYWTVVGDVTSSITGSGTISTTSGSINVIGSSTSFLTQLAVGKTLATSSGTIIGTIATITSNTDLTLNLAASVSYSNISSYKTLDFAATGITSVGGSDKITVTWDTSTPVAGSVAAFETNSSGCSGNTSTYAVNVQSIPPGSVTGNTEVPNNNVTLGSTDQRSLETYTTTSQSYYSAYSWVVTGGKIVSGGSEYSSITNTVGVKTAEVGTLSVTSGTKNVTGASGSLFTGFRVGQVLYTSSNVVIGTIASIASNTSLTLVANATTTYTNISGFQTGGMENTIAVRWDVAGTGTVKVKGTTECSDSEYSTALSVDIYNLIYSTSSGSWSASATSFWSCNCVPTSLDNVLISTGHIVAITNGSGVSVKNLIVAGTLSGSSTARSISVSGDLTMINGGIIGNGQPGGLNLISGSTSTQEIIGTGTINPTTGGINIQSNRSINSSASITTGTGALNISSGVTLTNNGTVTVGSGGISGADATSIWTNSASSTLNVAGALLSTGTLNASASGNIVNYNGTGAQTIKTPSSSQYANLSFNNTTATGIASPSASATLNVSEAWTNNATTAVSGYYGFNPNNGKIVFNGTSDQTISGSGTSPFKFYDLDLSGSGTVKTFSVPIELENNLEINSGVKANLSTSTTHVANSLTFASASQATGTWGSTSSTATHQDNTRFSSTTGYITIGCFGTPSSNPTVCPNVAITNITIGAPGVSSIGTITNLPTGLTATLSTHVVTISGTPTATAGTYGYSILVTGGSCIGSNITGTIIISNNTASAASSSPTLCINTALTNITHTTVLATGISNDGVSGGNGLPAGVSATWASNTITISGTPTASGTFNYSIPLTGGCGSVNATGTIIVNPASVAGSISGAATVCTGTNSTVLTLSGNTGTIQWQSSPDNSTFSNLVGSTGSTYTATNLLATTYYRAVVTSGVCSSATTSSVTMTVNPASVSGSISGAATVCTGTNSTVLTLSGNTGTIQWQSSPDNSTFSDIGGATGSTYTATNLLATTYYRAVVTSGVCSSATTSSVTMTVNPNASITSVTGANTICVGATSSYTTLGLVLGGGTGAWSSDNTSVAIVDVNGSVTTLTTGTFNIIYTITGGCGVSPISASKSVTVNNTTQWLGFNSNWTDPTNWTCGIPPGSGTDVTIPNVGGNSYPVISASINIKSLTIASGASATINSGTINLTGDLINDGTLTNTGGTISFNGTSQNVSGASVTTFNDIIVNGSNVTLTSPQKLKGSLTFSGGSFKTNGLPLGKLTLLSTSATQAASIGNLNGITFTGPITVQRYQPNPGKNSFSYVASPVSNATISDLNTDFGNTIVFIYNEVLSGPANTGFARVATSANFVSGVGYAHQETTNNTRTWDVTGSLISPNTVPNEPGSRDNVSLALSYTDTNPSNNSTDADDGWNLLGNPYPSAVDLSKLSFSGSMDNIVYVLDNTLGSLTYQTWSSGIGGTIPGGILALGQSFEVHAKGIGAHLDFSENAKVSTSSGTYFRKKESTLPVLQVALSRGLVRDASFLVLDEGSTSAYSDKNDALKRFGNDLGISLTAKSGEPLVYYATEGITEDDIEVNVMAYNTGTYTISFDATEWQEGFDDLYFIDKYLGISQQIRDSKHYTFEIGQVQENTIRNRFYLSKYPLPEKELKLTLFPNPVTDRLQVEINTENQSIVKVMNLEGALVAQTSLKSEAHISKGEISLSELTSGVYIVIVNFDNRVISKKIIKN